MVAFSELLQSITANGDHFTVTVGEDWLQGRTAYGGLAGALCLESAMRHVPDLPPLRSAQFAFAGPATGPLTLRASVLRRGKSTAFINVDLSGDAGFATRAMFCFGAARQSALAYPAPPAATVPPPEQCEDFFRFAPPALSFAQHFDGRLAAGHLAFSRAGDPEMTLWLKHRDPQDPASAVALLALADAPPPAALVLFEKPAPISTMTWAIDILTDELTTTDGWWLVRASADHIDNGYSSQTTTIWNASGAPALVARQNIAVFI